MENVSHYLLAGKNPAALALTFPQSSHSYGTLTAQAGLVAAYLRGLGAQKGDRVLLIHQQRAVLRVASREEQLGGRADARELVLRLRLVVQLDRGFERTP